MFVFIMLGQREILNKELVEIIIDRLSHQLIEVHNDFNKSVIRPFFPKYFTLRLCIESSVLDFSNSESASLRTFETSIRIS